MTKLYIWLTTDSCMQKIERDFCICLFLLLLGSFISPFHYNITRLTCFCGILFYSVKILGTAMKYISEDQ